MSYLTDYKPKRRSVNYSTLTTAAIILGLKEAFYLVINSLSDPLICFRKWDYRIKTILYNTVKALASLRWIGT